MAVRIKLPSRFQKRTALVGDVRNMYKILAQKLEKRKPFGRHVDKCIAK
jgi:hypothetical protein